MVLGNVTLGCGLLTAFLLAACQADAIGGKVTEGSAIKAPTAVAEAERSSGQSLPIPEYKYTVGRHQISLLVEADACLLAHGIDGKNIETFKLDLRPPCYLLTWQRPPPQLGDRKGPSDGVPVGEIGDPVAWRYRSAQGAIALAVIGDPVPDDMRLSKAYKFRQEQGYRCASSMQGVLLQGDKARLSKKRENVAIFCVESGAEEKDFWMLSHE
jgi:hypothetical protein